MYPNSKKHINGFINVQERTSLYPKKKIKSLDPQQKNIHQRVFTF